MNPDSPQTRRTFLKASAVATAGVSSIEAAFALTASPDDLTCLSATELAARIAERNVSCVEAVRAYLDRIEKINPKINAIVQLRAEEALKEAQRADKDLGLGRKRGPLHGVPFTLKDNLATAGIFTTAGMAELAKYIPMNDATVTKRLKAAGGILLGKTNVPEFCMFADTYNLVYPKKDSQPKRSITCSWWQQRRRGRHHRGLRVRVRRRHGHRRQHSHAKPLLRHRGPQTDHRSRA